MEIRETERGERQWSRVNYFTAARFEAPVPIQSQADFALKHEVRCAAVQEVSEWDQDERPEVRFDYPHGQDMRPVVVSHLGCCEIRGGVSR